jgi:hypothetical protein
MLQSRSPVGPEAAHFMSSCLTRIGLLVHLHDFVEVFRRIVETDLDKLDCCIVVVPLRVCILSLHWL